jgi:hypothetical protein
MGKRKSRIVKIRLSEGIDRAYIEGQINRFGRGANVSPKPYLQFIDPLLEMYEAGVFEMMRLNTVYIDPNQGICQISRDKKKGGATLSPIHY